LLNELKDNKDDGFVQWVEKKGRKGRQVRFRVPKYRKRRQKNYMHKRYF